MADLDPSRVELDTLSPPDLHAWRMTGTLPDASSAPAEPAEAPADAEPVPPAEPVTAVPVVPATEPWTDPETGVPIEKPTRGDKRIKRLWQDAQDAKKKTERLETELAALKARADAGSNTRHAVPQLDERAPIAAVDASDPEPTEDAIGTTYADYSQFVRALAKWEGRQEARTIARAELADRDQRDQGERATRQFAERVDAFKATPAGKDFDAVVASGAHLPLDDHGAMAGVIRHHPSGPALQQYLCAHPRDCERIAALPTGPALIELGMLLASIAAATPAIDPGSLVTQHPDPPRTLGSRPATPADPLVRAIATDDYATYRDLMNKRDLAARR